MNRIDRDFVKAHLPPRTRDSHKGHYGKLLILAGSVGFTGACRLCAIGAVRAGAGLVYAGVPRSCWPVIAACEPEPMVFPLHEDAGGRISRAALPLIQEKMEGMDACVCGPGLGRSDALPGIVKAVLSCGKPVVLDADGINALDGHIIECPAVLTPHEGEFLRAGGELSGGREKGALEFAEKRGCVVVLKGHGTVVASPEGRVMVNTTGNPGLAKGGSGDLLAGMTGALIAQGLPLFEASACAVWLHGRAGDICACRLGMVAMTPSDVAASLPDALRECAP